MKIFSKGTALRFLFKCAAFTLAEVLITLGIIGVVAALTIPVLISKHEKSVIEAGFQKTYAELENIIMKNKDEYGEFSQWDLSGGVNQVVNKYFAPYLDLTRCRGVGSSVGPKCTEDIFAVWYAPTSTAARGDRFISNSNHVPYMLKDGRIYFIRVTNSGTIRAIEVIADVNGLRGRTVMGQDVFIFSINTFRTMKDRLKFGSPEGFSSLSTPTETLRSQCVGYGNYELYKGAICGFLLQRNGGKFPKDYPIKF